MTEYRSRREFLRELGLSAAAMPFLLNLPSLGFANSVARKQRLIVMFSPNGIVPKTFWPDEEGADFALKASLAPLEPFKDRMQVVRGVSDRVGGDGDAHMRGIGCLLTGAELFPGNIQGGSHTPAGWCSSHSIDQELKTWLQGQPEHRTRFGSLEFGVLVPERADTWTRMSYAGANKPLAPVDNPYQMFKKLYGRTKDQAALRSVMDELQADFAKVAPQLSHADRQLLEEHATFVREMEQELQADAQHAHGHAAPELEPGVPAQNDQMPKLSRMQIELMVNSFAADFARVATFQYTNSVGQARMRWLGIEENHHELSHHGDDNAASQDQLTRINTWFCGELAYLAQRLAETPEPGGPGSLLDHTTIVWTNELGQGNSHTLDNIPFVLVGNGLNFKMGQSLKYKNVPHNRLLMTLAHGMGHRLTKFGNPDYCGDGILTELML